MDVLILQAFAARLQQKFSLPGDAFEEDQLKGPVEKLLEDAGSQFELPAVGAKSEASLAEFSVRPDMAVYVGGLICGYIELKAPGIGADAPRFKNKRNKKQWDRLKGLPNLIYSDGQQWALYRHGERRGVIVSLENDPTVEGRSAVTETNAKALGSLLRDFLDWEPHVPHKPEKLAPYLANLTRFLRAEVEVALADSNSAVSLLAGEWRQNFLPEADDAQFADAYAQTVAYALLLARLAGAEGLDPAQAGATLDKNNGVLAAALERLGHKDARQELRVGFELLQRSLLALDPNRFAKSDPEVWLYFYETFLAKYDPALRKDYGVYYTPRAVVELQVRLVSELLESRFDKHAGFADDGVVFLDPAVGTGTYLIAAVKHSIPKIRERYGIGQQAARAKQMARNMYGFEVLIGPYAVAHLRLTQVIESVGASIDDRLQIYLSNTLESPNVKPKHTMSLTYRVLTQERQAAHKVKTEGDILVCIGNPPYGRQQIDENDVTTQRKGGWVRFGDEDAGGADPEKQGDRTILQDFTEPAAEAGASVHIKNLYNDYVFFWRWALWRLFEQQQCGGIVSFITASSYLRGPGFVGMREVMRRTFDDLWIIDLGGDNISTRKTPNVFNIKTPVAIAIGVRGKDANPDVPATVRYAKIDGITREKKLTSLDKVDDFAKLDWVTCPCGWQSHFLPQGHGDFFGWPSLTNIFPWQHSGIQFKRSWTIGENEDVLRARLLRLTNANFDKKKEFFRETGSRKITGDYQDLSGAKLPKIATITGEDSFPKLLRYAYRHFDRHYAIVDNRFCDRLRPPLVHVAGPKNLYFTSLIFEVLGTGSAIGVTAEIPDLHVFCGRGGKDVIPLFRDQEAKQPNITPGLLDRLGAFYDSTPTPEDLASYVYALLGGQSYTRRFWNELEIPGVRVPITKDESVFADVVALGRRLIWVHTFAQRFGGEDLGNQVPAGIARCVEPISDAPERYPESYAWDKATETVRIGGGAFFPVPRAIWEFEVSGWLVVQSWLAYRMKKRKGRRSSPLDDIRPERWTAHMTEEFLEMVWVLEETLAMEPKLEQSLDRVLSSPCFLSSDLPLPGDEDGRPPAIAGCSNTTMRLFGAQKP